jgi:hypothetical protein
MPSVAAMHWLGLPGLKSTSVIRVETVLLQEFPPLVLRQMPLLVAASKSWLLVGEMTRRFT